jgi:GcrA cell cycle regulator
MDWTPEAIERLRALWAEGHSTAEIGRRMGITKNAVVGKAHRLNLSARPSPIRREAPGDAKPVVPRAPKVAVIAPRMTLPVVPVAAAAPAPVEPRAVPAPAPVVRSFPRLSAMRSCCWPIGEPGTQGFRFCSAEASQGKPYCAEHAAVAYVKARDRREDAA